MKKAIVCLFGILIGIGGAYVTVLLLNKTEIKFLNIRETPEKLKLSKEVIGFLPYWFLDTASADYSSYVTTIDYFSLTIDKDGTILKSNEAGEMEPGYYALTSGKADTFLQNARNKKIKLSLTAFSGDQESIDTLISDPVNNANRLVDDFLPIMRTYGFSDLNLDVEPTNLASSSAQVNYQKFVGEISSRLKPQGITLSDDMIPVDFIRHDHLARPENLVSYLDKVIVMAYDFHSPGSFVTGPVAPLYGAGSVAELDTNVVIEAALKSYDSSKVLLGIPFYGYTWETINDFPRAATIPTTADIESNKEALDLLSKCASCSSQLDPVAQEKYIIYKNSLSPDKNGDFGTYQQIFYQDEDTVSAKISYVEGNKLGGVAIWALGYEGSSILKPIQDYLKH